MTEPLAAGQQGERFPEELRMMKELERLKDTLARIHDLAAVYADQSDCPLTRDIHFGFMQIALWSVP